MHNPKYPSFTSDIVSAITHAPDSEALLQAMLTGGEWNRNQVRTQSWYDNHVLKDSKDFVSQYLEAWEKAAEEVTKSGAAPRGMGTGMAVAVAGVAAGVIAAVL
ncbi:hypothetical protein QC764_400565 [Podospora pseudoanserina]|nr:hypothetical protein QC764_400565 [Podospora pseudoanserina]